MSDALAEHLSDEVAAAEAFAVDVFFAIDVGLSELSDEAEQATAWGELLRLVAAIYTFDAAQACGAEASDVASSVLAELLGPANGAVAEGVLTASRNRFSAEFFGVGEVAAVARLAWIVAAQIKAAEISGLLWTDEANWPTLIDPDRRVQVSSVLRADVDNLIGFLLTDVDLSFGDHSSLADAACPDDALVIVHEALLDTLIQLSAETDTEFWCSPAGYYEFVERL